MIVKTFTLIILTALFAGISIKLEAQTKITDGSVLTMDPNSLLELESTNKGLLIPRMALNNLNLASPLVGTVPAGMQVYSLGGSIADGFYYWNGSKWVRMVASTDPVMNLNMVSKSANATLLITENMVLASGDITLTLPSVTVADNGLEITIKNVGTYTDLITVIAQSGKVMDVSSSSVLTRWKGRTFIANGTNWIVKEKETRMDNLLGVSESGSFTTIAEVVAFLNAHMTGPSVVELGAGTYQIDATQTINLGYPVTFIGSSFGETKIVGASGVSGNPMFNCLTECNFKMLSFTAYSNAAGNDGIRLSGAGKYHEIKDCSFKGFNKGLVSTTNQSLLWAFELDFESCTGAGIEIAAGSASGGEVRVSECTFSQCAKGINLLSGIGENITIINSSFVNTLSGTDIGILYVPANFSSFSSMYITSNTWNNQGSFTSGFDFSRPDGRDANAYLISNLGMENENPHAKIGVNNNTSKTNLTSPGTYSKAVWGSNTSEYTCKWTIGSTSPTSGNRFKYQPTNKRDGWAIITGNISVANNNRVITIAVCKNGNTVIRFGDTDLRITTANQPFQFSTAIYVPDLAKDDYLELFATSSGNNEVITFQDIQWFINTQ
jgi:hypothetical protein